MGRTTRIRAAVLTGATAAAMAATALTGVSVAGAAAPAGEGYATVPFDCPAKSVCVYDQSDGLGPYYAVQIPWAGGYTLHELGWADRVSAYRSTSAYPRWLYQEDGVEPDRCWHLRAVVAPGQSGALPPEADGAVDTVANMEFPQCP